MKVTPTTKVAAVALMGAFLAQPVLGTLACWQMASAAGLCAGRCPMTEEEPADNPAKAESSAPDCCLLSSPEPVSPTALMVSSQTTQAPVVKAATAQPLVAALPPSTLQRDASAPHLSDSHSLSSLHCVFLI